MIVRKVIYIFHKRNLQTQIRRFFIRCTCVTTAFHATNQSRDDIVSFCCTPEFRFFTATDNHYTIRDVESCKGFEISILAVISEYYEIIA